MPAFLLHISIPPWSTNQAQALAHMAQVSPRHKFEHYQVSQNIKVARLDILKLSLTAL
ncbi:hypothetical protein BT69DRAFT_1289823 [Atractiella rhizophila]|nr:hypothetical protein BT69DRAFT_1289823 [Atractiella rhizophila]